MKNIVDYLKLGSGKRAPSILMILMMMMIMMMVMMMMMMMMMRRMRRRRKKKKMMIMMRMKTTTKERKIQAPTKAKKPSELALANNPESDVALCLAPPPPLPQEIQSLDAKSIQNQLLLEIQKYTIVLCTEARLSTLQL